VDTETLEQMAPKTCHKCKSKIKTWWITKRKDPSPPLNWKCTNCSVKKKVETSKTWNGNSYICFTYMMLLVSILLIGSTWDRVSSLFSLLEINAGDKSTYHTKACTLVDDAVNKVTQQFLADCRKKIADINDVYLMIDAGWSHPGWWARECTVIGVDCQTGLPISVYHVMRGKNYEGSSKGNHISFNTEHHKAWRDLQLNK